VRTGFLSPEGLVWFLINSIAATGPLGWGTWVSGKTVLDDIPFMHPAEEDGLSSMVRWFYDELCEEHPGLTPLEPQDVAAEAPTLLDMNRSSDILGGFPRRRLKMHRSWSRLAAEQPDKATWHYDVQANEWHNLLDGSGIPAIDWRRQAAFQLRSIPVATLVTTLEQTLDQIVADMHRAVEIKLGTVGPGDDRPVPYPLFLALWRHATDRIDSPLIQALADLCQTPDARLFAETMTAMRPLTLVDFLFAVAEQHRLTNKDGPGWFNIQKHRPTGARAYHRATSVARSRYNQLQGRSVAPADHSFVIRVPI
jgi:hypothetical protein